MNNEELGQEIFKEFLDNVMEVKTEDTGQWLYGFNWKLRRA